MFKARPKHVDISDPVVALLDASLKVKRDAEPDRQYLGASLLGEKCERKLAYGWHGRKPNFSGRVYRIFDQGHDTEERMTEYLRLAGFDLATHQSNGKQFGYWDADGKLGGHSDGIFTGGPDIEGLVYPALWECKGLNSKNFKKVSKDGLRKYSDTYAAQVDLYMCHFRLEQCLYTVLNKDTAEVYVELIPVDMKNAQAASDRGARIISSESPDEFPRIARDKDDFRCRFCDFKDECWTTAPTTQQQLPPWLQKENQ